MIDIHIFDSRYNKPYNGYTFSLFILIDLTSRKKLFVTHKDIIITLFKLEIFFFDFEIHLFDLIQSIFCVIKNIFNAWRNYLFKETIGCLRIYLKF